MRKQDKKCKFFFQVYSICKTSLVRITHHSVRHNFPFSHLFLSLAVVANSVPWIWHQCTQSKLLVREDITYLGHILCIYIYIYTRSLWALRARLLVGDPSGRFRPFGPAFGPSGLLTHYPTANTLSNPWIVC